MTSLIFAAIVAALFIALLTYESGSDQTKLQFRPAGLLTWLTSGNWPAKVGAGLIIIGVGALLRYAFANIDVPPEMKLGTGVLTAAALGFGSMILKSQPKRRAIHLALAGAAFGIAYLTAYSAYGFFNYITDVNALALLALVAIAAGVFAVQSNVMSVAILAMIGAYIAPKFSLGTPGVLPVYGYFLAASVLSLVMVTLRGWRPLIHLSFLFTLAGALFFAWDGKFYESEHYSIMQPLLLALVAVHLAMPLLEKKFTRSTRVAQFDTAYFIALPLVGAALTLKIAPNLQTEGAAGLGALASLWVIAAGFLYMRKDSQSTRHAIVAILLAIAATLSWFEDLPWLLIWLGTSVAIMAAAPKLGLSERMEGLACGAALLLGILHVIQSIMLPEPMRAFLNELFAHRVIASALMITGAWAVFRRRTELATVLGAVGFGWIVLAVIAELVRLHIDFLPQLSYGLILGLLVLVARLGYGNALSGSVAVLLLLALTVSGWWAALGASIYTAIAYLIATPASLLVLAHSGSNESKEGRIDFPIAMGLGLLPVLLLPWALATANLADIHRWFFEGTIVIIGFGIAGVAGRTWLSTSARWNNQIQPAHVYATAGLLLWVTLIHIERGIWPIAFELLALAYLITYVAMRSKDRADVSGVIVTATVGSVALVLQSMLLRSFGPDIPIMNALDIRAMHLPAVVSLLWVVFGSGLAWWGSNTKDRFLWSLGSGLLAAAALKLVLFDFGTLGQLGNIIAFIVAGAMFMGVAWVAPIPPKPERSADPEPQDGVTQESARIDQGARKSAQSAGENQGPAEALLDSSQKIKTGAYLPGKQTPIKEPGSGVIVVVLAVFVAVALSLFAMYQIKQYAAKKRIAERASIVEERERVQQQAAMNSRSAPLSRQPTTSEMIVAPRQMAAGTSKQGPAEEASAPNNNQKACPRFADPLPSDFIVYAAGAYGGRPIQQQIDQSGRSATQIDVFVNQPGKPIALMLGAYEPTLWTVHVAEGTHVAAVLTSGYHRQIVVGLRPSTPSFISTNENKGPCEYFYVAPNTLSKLNPIARQIFGKPVDTVFPAKNGIVAIGALAKEQSAPQATQPAMVSLSGDAALDAAVRKGIIRRATAADADAWVAVVGPGDVPYVDGEGIPKVKRPGLFKAYVVLAGFTYPTGLFGANSATFFIPVGVPSPTGNPGHSAIYDFTTRLCRGAACGR